MHIYKILKLLKILYKRIIFLCYDNLRKKHKGLENDLVMSAHSAPSEVPSLIPSTHIG